MKITIFLFLDGLFGFGPQKRTFRTDFYRMALPLNKFVLILFVGTFWLGWNNSIRSYFTAVATGRVSRQGLWTISFNMASKHDFWRSSKYSSLYHGGCGFCFWARMVEEMSTWVSNVLPIQPWWLQWQKIGKGRPSRVQWREGDVIMHYRKKLTR